MGDDTKECGTCGAKLNSEGLCPACLLNAGLATRTTDIGDGPGGGPAKRPEVGGMFGDYRVARLLGRGGMGEVYEAEDARTGRRVAIKVLNQSLASDEDRRRFIREGRVAATVSDPHVVYVYGSEEIEGAPVIAMELATGGTLKDRIKRGRPPAPAEAVDDILQVIAGLEVAQAAGVLHRDIKPANCFVDRDGSVKVGDFGLSISTLGHLESLNLTAPGSLLGTPAFASPEQLRGSPLDVRSDIYSVGATLFFLLTGKPPFEADSIVALISAVLDREPPSPRAVHAGVSAGLAAVVVKCLAKDPKTRFANYDELRRALQPFSSAAPKAGTLGLRFVAGFVDSFFASLPATIYALTSGALLMKLLAPGGLTASRAALWLTFAAWMILYYAIPESRWGASFGKWLCGLRVIGPDKLTPTFGRSLLRALLYVLVAEWLQHLIVLLTHSREDALKLAQGEALSVASFCGLACWALLFVSMRRRNGFAALHDLATGTRVVANAAGQQARPELLWRRPDPGPSERRAVAPSRAATVGPYSVLDDARGPVVLAHDEVLRRNVWIVRQPNGTPPLEPARRDLARPGRVRWLNGVRSATEAWDAFEAPDGWRLGEVPAHVRIWSAVRFWLLDLAEEISAGMKSGALPPLAVENVYITVRGRALLLDAELAGSAAAARGAPPTLPDVQRFLSDVVTAALGEQPHGLPMDVPPFLDNLRNRSLHAMEFVLANLAAFTQKLPEVTRRRRAGNIFLAPACVLMIGVFVAVALYLAKRRGMNLQNPPEHEAVTMAAAFAVYASARDSANTSTCASVGGLIAARYATSVNNPDFWTSNPAFLFMSDDVVRRLRGAAEDAVKRHANPTEGKVKEGEALLKQFADERNISRGDKLPYIGPITACIGLLLLGLFNLVCSIIGVTPGLRLFGMAVVDRRGRRASRWRLVLRSLVGWSPIFLLPVLVAMFQPIVSTSAPGFAAISAGFAILWLAYAIQNITNPARGLHDRAAGTWVVPR